MQSENTKLLKFIITGLLADGTNSEQESCDYESQMPSEILWNSSQKF
jgi:hypothetical protein